MLSRRPMQSPDGVYKRAARRHLSVTALTDSLDVRVGWVGLGIVFCRVEIQCWRESIVRLEYVGSAKGSWERKRLRRAGSSVNDSRS
jgi:hypothetical protein